MDSMPEKLELKPERVQEMLARLPGWSLWPEGLGIQRVREYASTEGAKSFANAAELMQHMANGEQAHLCYAKKLASFGLQRDIVETDMPMLEALAATSRSASLKQVIVTLVQTDAFRNRSGAAP